MLNSEIARERKRWLQHSEGDYSGKNVFPDTDETQEKHTDAVKLPGRFFPPHFGVKRVPALHIYFYIQMLWIAPGKGRPFSQQEELILFLVFSLESKRRNFAMVFQGFISENLTTVK